MKRLLLTLALIPALAGGQEQEPAPPAPSAEEAGRSESATGPRSARFKTMDRLELGTTSITGNQELPKVMYVVPWKKAELGELAGKPARSLIDEILAPVDRDVFRREVGYFETLSEGIHGAGAQGENPVTPPAARP